MLARVLTPEYNHPAAELLPTDGENFKDDISYPSLSPRVFSSTPEQSSSCPSLTAGCPRLTRWNSCRDVTVGKPLMI